MYRKTILFLMAIIMLITISGLEDKAFSESDSHDTPQFLHCNNTDICDKEGKPVLLRGIGLGGWLVPEGYMLHTPQQSPSEIRRAIVALIGENRTEEFYRCYEDNFYTEADIKVFASWGLNSIRLPFNAKMFWDLEKNAFDESGFNRIDQLLGWCKKYQLYLILDMHCALGGQNALNISDSDGKARLWSEPKRYQSPTIEVWRRIAQRYGNEFWIGGYDLLNEPVLFANKKKLRELYIRITKAIREVDSNHIIFIEGNWWPTNYFKGEYGADFRELLPPWDDNMVYSFHKYFDKNSVESIKTYLEIREKANVPLWMGETGENSNHWISSLIKILEDNRIGWSFWAPKKLENVSNAYSAYIPQKYQRILDYWNGRASKPSAEEASDGLFEMAKNLTLSSCRFYPDVVAALTDQEFSFTLYVLNGSFEISQIIIE